MKYLLSSENPQYNEKAVGNVVTNNERTNNKKKAELYLDDDVSNGKHMEKQEVVRFLMF